MGNKQDELEISVQSKVHDIIVITETWKDTSHDWIAVMDGCVLFKKDRLVRQASLYVREHLESIEVHLRMNDEQVENLLI